MFSIQFLLSFRSLSAVAKHRKIEFSCFVFIECDDLPLRLVCLKARFRNSALFGARLGRAAARFLACRCSIMMTYPDTPSCAARGGAAQGRRDEEAGGKGVSGRDQSSSPSDGRGTTNAARTGGGMGGVRALDGLPDDLVEDEVVGAVLDRRGRASATPRPPRRSRQVLARRGRPGPGGACRASGRAWP